MQSLKRKSDETHVNDGFRLSLCVKTPAKTFTSYSVEKSTS